MQECIIIGGGVAGLSAANRLADLGISSLLIDAGSYPSHRLCGEFFSPECVPFLEKWEIPLSNTLRRCCFIFKSSEVNFRLSQPAKGESREQFDMHLLERARRRGVSILTEAACSALRMPENSQGYYEVELANGQTYKTKHLMVGTGKLSALANGKPTMKYVGFKAHFAGISTAEDLLEMHCFKGGYIGMSTIAPGVVNIACLARLSPNSQSISQILAYNGLEKLSRRITQGQMLYHEWLTSQLPEFGIRDRPNWPNTYWIGDAAGSIPPVCGEGLSIAITTGIMAAEYFVNYNAETFRKDWLHRYSSRFYWGKCLHHVVMQPVFCRVGAILCHIFPFLPNTIFKLTRENMGLV